ncbi:MAG: fused MFS/spermidine synthase [Bryobacterales bacterium]|nr:fused MFS/spermidine synthase [Bryobacterales bacterium]
MTTPAQTAVEAPASSSSRFLPVLLLLFAGSGCSALIYEVVWYQLLQLAIGSTSVSLGILLATFMGGLCIGSIGFPRLKLRQRPLRVYAALELGIGALGIIVLFALPLLVRLYIAAVGLGLPGMLLRGFIAAICLLPPTILMGASLPAIVRWGESERQDASWWGLLYGGNTAGAVLGCLLAGFYLLRVHNTAVATYAAVAINVAVALISLAVAARTPGGGQTDPAENVVGSDAAGSGSNWAVYVTIALSGACALGAEVVWTRLMGYLMGATVYVFSIILAVFLTGLALGSWIGSLLVRSVRPKAALGWCQILLCGGIAWTAYMISDSLPYWPINPMLAQSPWFTFQIDLARCLWTILPPTILWGASFPLALAAIRKTGDPGRMVGAVYAANTLGAIAGALGVSLILVPWIGTQQTQRLLLLVSAASALFTLVPHIRERRSLATTIALTAALLIAGRLASGLDAVPGELIAYGRRMPLNVGQSEILYTAEGRNSSVAISRWYNGATYVNVNGHVEATTEIYDMKLQRMVGHLPALLHPNPKSVLGIGFGAGVSAGTFTRYPGIEHITVCEIEPVIPPTSTRYFGPQNYSVMLNPKTRIVYDDARHYVLTTRDKYDIIASDPLDVFVKGTAALYSKEYFDVVKQHLNPGGMFTLYVPLYESDEKTVRSELATFFASFPYGSVWANTRDGQGYDMVFMGQADPLKIDLDEIQARWNRPDYAPVVQSLREVGIPSIIDLFGTYTGGLSDLGEWTKGSDINTDKDLRLQYIAGWGINSQLEDYIYRQMLRYRRLPQNVFTGSPDLVNSVLLAIRTGR